MAQKARTPYKRENLQVSRLEADMLEYQLKEARDTIEKQKEELGKSAMLLEQNRYSYTGTVNSLIKHSRYWKLVAIIEGVSIIAYVIAQGV